MEANMQKQNGLNVFKQTKGFLATIHVLLIVWQILTLLGILVIMEQEIPFTDIQFFIFFFVWLFQWYIVSGVKSIKKTFSYIESHLESTDLEGDSNSNHQ